MALHLGLSPAPKSEDETFPFTPTGPLPDCIHRFGISDETVDTTPPLPRVERTYAGEWQEQGPKEWLYPSQVEDTKAPDLGRHAGDGYRIRMLLKYKKTFIDKDGNDWQPLYWASTRGLCDIARHLLEEGADPNEKTQQALKGHVDMINLLISKGANVELQNGAGFLPLHVAAEAGQEKVIPQLLGAFAEVSPNAKSRSGETALHLAARNGHLKAVEQLVGEGAALDTTNEIVATPLHVAAFGGHTEVIKLLISKGADIDAIDCEKNTPLHSACAGGAGIESIRALVVRGADVNKKDSNGFTPLHSAAMTGSSASIATMIQCGGDPNLQNGNGLAPLHLAAYEGKSGEILTALCRGGADANLLDEDGNNPLHLVVRHNRMDLLVCLIRYGCDVTHRNKLGKRPGDLATHEGVIRLLEAKVQKVERDRENGSTV